VDQLLQMVRDSDV